MNSELDEIRDIIEETIKEHIRKYDYSCWRRMEYKFNVRFFDKIKNKTKNISTRYGPNRTIVASNGRYKFVEINDFKILIEGEIKRDVINTYMKCHNLPLLWRKIFTNRANNRDYIIKYCNRLNKIDKHLREWYISNNPYDDEIQQLMIN